ncbi:MAG: hypothetical protein U0457_16705 [Candidatus Sericytochromatia bacterium]
MKKSILLISLITLSCTQNNLNSENKIEKKLPIINVTPKPTSSEIPTNILNSQTPTPISLISSSPSNPPILIKNTSTKETCKEYFSKTENYLDILPTPSNGITQRNDLIKNGGKLVSLNGRYYIIWIPDSFYSSTKKTIIYDLHGTGGYPEAEWNDWNAIFKDKGIAFISYAWGGATINTYKDIYNSFKKIDDDLAQVCPIENTNKWLMGFSVGSAVSFGVILQDKLERKMFSGTISNSGASWSPKQTGIEVMHPFVEAQKSNLKAYEGIKTWMYCGEKDFDHTWSMCDEMDLAKKLIDTHGGISILYRDPNGLHGSLHKNNEAVKELLEYISK